MADCRSEPGSRTTSRDCAPRSEAIISAWWRDYFTFDTPITSATPTSAGHLFTATAVAGYRWRFSGLFAEVALGGGMYRHKDPRTVNALQGLASSEPPATYGAIPDVAVGVGFTSQLVPGRVPHRLRRPRCMKLCPQQARSDARRN